MKIMAKIKELLAGREKLAKYDELTEWKYFLESGKPQFIHYEYPTDFVMIANGREIYEIPDHIKQIIVSALDAEIKKLDEE